MPEYMTTITEELAAQLASEHTIVWMNPEPRTTTRNSKNQRFLSEVKNNKWTWAVFKEATSRANYYGYRSRYPEFEWDFNTHLAGEHKNKVRVFVRYTGE